MSYLVESWVRRAAHVVFGGLLLLPMGVLAADDDGVKIPGKFDIDLNYRYESVDIDSPTFPDDAQATTLRTSIGYATPSFAGFSARVRFEDVTDLGYENAHNNRGAGSLFNGVTDRPVIADPEITDILEAALEYKFGSDLKIIAGRSTINLGEQRFVGAVPWRQHWQSFDLLQVNVGAIPRTKITAALVDSVHRIFGDTLSMENSTFLNVIVDAGAIGDLTVYRYDLDYDDVAFLGLSTETIGLRLAGTATPADSVKVRWHGEIAEQKDGGDNPADIDADYLRLEGAVNVHEYGVVLGREVLGGSIADGAFQTPLATLHKWNGWADLFLATPANGLEDSYLKLLWKDHGFAAQVAYHDYTSDSADRDYGDELNAQLSWKSSWNQTFAIKLARYSADTFGADRDVAWAWTSFKWDSEKLR